MEAGGDGSSLALQHGQGEGCEGDVRARGMGEAEEGAGEVEGEGDVTRGGLQGQGTQGCLHQRVDEGV